MGTQAVRGFFKSLFEENPLSDDNSSDGGEVGEQDNNGLDTSRSISLPLRPTSSSSEIEGFQAIGSTNLYDPAYEKRVREAIVAANLPGNDYFEFAVAVNAAMNDPEDRKPEDSAFRTTFKTIKSLDGVFSVETLLSSSDHYIGVAERVLSDFQSETNEAIRLAQQDMDTLIKDLRKPLDAVKDKEAASEIEQSIKEKIVLRMEKVRGHQENRLAKMKFVVDRVVGELRKDQDRINRYLNKPVTK